MSSPMENLENFTGQTLSHFGRQLGQLRNGFKVAPSIPSNDSVQIFVSKTRSKKKVPTSKRKFNQKIRSYKSPVNLDLPDDLAVYLLEKLLPKVLVHETIEANIEELTEKIISGEVSHAYLFIRPNVTIDGREVDSRSLSRVKYVIDERGIQVPLSFVPEENLAVLNPTIPIVAELLTDFFEYWNAE